MLNLHHKRPWTFSASKGITGDQTETSDQIYQTAMSNGTDCERSTRHSVEAKNILSLQFIGVVWKLSNTVARCLHVYHREVALQATWRAELGYNIWAAAVHLSFQLSSRSFHNTEQNPFQMWIPVEFQETHTHTIHRSVHPHVRHVSRVSKTTG